MKKLFCFLLCLTLIFSSVSLCFASPTQWDTSDQSNLQGILRAVTSYGTSNLYYYVSQIYSLTNTISNNVNTIKGYLTDSNHGVAYWVQAISTWMSPIYNAITNIPVDLSTIIGSLGYFDSNNTYHPYLNEINTAMDLFKQSWSFSVTSYSASQGPQTTTWNETSYPKAVIDLLRTNSQNQAFGFNNLVSRTAYGDAQRNFYDWTDLSVDSFTPRSWADSQLILLSNIQKPLARLSYVLASDERIEAQEAAAANEEAVVDNFIDSSGNGASSPSDIGSVSDLSSGYKQNFGSDASPSGIFDIFNAEHATWFSQETKEQLDTTTPSKMTKGFTSDTPLLDKQIQDIYDALGVKQP